MKKVTMEYRVPYADTDQMGVVYYANYLALFERARNELMRSYGYTYKECEAEGFLLPVVHAEADYKSSARYDDLLEVTAWVSMMKGVRIEIACEVRRKGEDAVLVSGYTRHCFVSSKDFRPVQPPARLRELIAASDGVVSGEGAGRTESGLSRAMKAAKSVALVAALAVATVLGATAAPRPAPRPALMARLAEGIDLIGIVHWGLNTYTDREWGYGDEDPALLNPSRFDADQIVRACRDGGLKGLVVVAKHHDGFCLWPTKTTEHNIAKTPFWRGTGNGERGRDYVKEMEQACRRHGLRFGVYVSPWDRNSAHYATDRYVEIYHAQIKELLGGGYGEVFEMWFDGANGGDGWYGGAKETRKIGVAGDYYRFGDVFRFVRALQPGVAIFAGESDDSDFRWPGNERGILDPDSRATSVAVGGIANGKYGNPAYKPQINTGTADGSFFRMCEADFPLRKGWFYHERERGTTKRAAYLAQRYVGTAGNGGTMNVGIAPNKDGVLDEDDVCELRGFKAIVDALFAHETKSGERFNIVELREDLVNGEQVDGWRLMADGREILAGKSIGYRRIRLLPEPIAPADLRLEVTADGGSARPVAVRRFFADPVLVKMVVSATGDCGETDTAKAGFAEKGK